MKFFFIDNTEEQADVTKELLQKWSVPFRVIPHRVYGGFFTTVTSYDIQINVSCEFFEFLKQERQKKLQELNNLEKSWQLPSYNPNGEDSTKEEPQEDNGVQLAWAYPEEAHVPQEIFDGQELKCVPGEDLDKLFENEELQNATKETEDFNADISKLLQWAIDNDLKLPSEKQVNFDDLSKAIQDTLLKDFTKEELQAPDCMILVSPIGIRISKK